MQRLLGKKREAVEALLSCRWAGCCSRVPAGTACCDQTGLRSRHPAPRRSYPLSEGLRQRIATDIKHHSSAGFLCQLCLGICLPSGLLTGTGAWDYDRDMDVLRREAAAVLGRCLAPEEYDLREHIDRCARECAVDRREWARPAAWDSSPRAVGCALRLAGARGARGQAWAGPTGPTAPPAARPPAARRRGPTENACSRCTSSRQLPVRYCSPAGPLAE